MSIRRDLHQANRASWNSATPVHNQHKRDQAGWLANGGELLFAEDYALLGPLAGRRVLHLLCNSEQDTLCIARRGAAVTGVDISDEAIGFARALSADSGIAAEFERGDVYDWLPEAAAAGRRFDVVYSSYGWLGWLSDLDAWAAGVARILAPGGRLALVEFHPFVWLFDHERRLAYGYTHDPAGDLVPEGVSDYVGRSGEALAPSGFVERAEPYANPHPCHWFAWTIADLLGAIRRAGLELERFDEWDYANGCQFWPDVVRVDDADGRRWTMPPGQPKLPMMMGLLARKPGPRVVQVDAFAEAAFAGNPAAVVVVDEPLDDATRQAIAAEHNLSETAFVERPGPGELDYRLRWFTPTTEVPLCGHATLASAFVVLTELEPEREAVGFTTASGRLEVRRAPGNSHLTLDLPADPPRPVAEDPGFGAALGAAPVELHRAGYWLAVFASEAEVRALRPDFAAVLGIPPGEVVVTAPADDPELDFVSRFFAPGVGIDEDPVTGSAHCILAPYWAARLGKPRLRARQISARGGALECAVVGDRVELTGACVRYSSGRIAARVTGTTGPE